MNRRGFLPALLVGLWVFLPQAGAEDWKVVWKDASRTLRLDRDSVRADGPQVAYWYSDEEDALVDFMEHRYRAVSDCENSRMRILEVHDPSTGETRPVRETGWKEMPYEPENPLWVMHDEVCREYAGR